MRDDYRICFREMLENVLNFRRRYRHRRYMNIRTFYTSGRRSWERLIFEVADRLLQRYGYQADGHARGGSFSSKHVQYSSSLGASESVHQQILSPVVTTICMSDSNPPVIFYAQVTYCILPRDMLNSSSATTHLLLHRKSPTSWQSKIYRTKGSMWVTGVWNRIYVQCLGVIRCLLLYLALKFPTF